MKHDEDTAYEEVPRYVIYHNTVVGLYNHICADLNDLDFLVEV